MPADSPHIPKPLIIIDTGIIGGPGKGLFQFLRCAAPRGLRFHLATFQYNRPRSTEFIDRARELQLPMTLLPQRFRFDPLALQSAVHTARDNGCQLVQSHGYKSHLVAYAVARTLRLPWVAFAHGWTAEDWKVRLYHRLDYVLLRAADAVIAVSPPLFETLRLLRAEKPTYLIPNAVDGSDLARDRGAGEVRSSLGISREALVIGCFGRLSHEKGQDLLLDSMEVVWQQNPRTHLLIVGDGPSRAALEQRRQRSTRSRQVHFMGHQRAMGDLFDAIDILALPSRSEGLPNVLLEAMACGVPVVATAVGAVPEVVLDQRHGSVVPPYDPQRFGQALASLASDPAGRGAIAVAARDMVHSRYSPHERTDRILEVYERVVSAPTPLSAWSDV